jgi:membrane associated rhomboid family serine protease
LPEEEGQEGDAAPLLVASAPGAAPVVETPAASAVPEPFSFLLRLRRLHPYPLVTPLLVVVTAGLFVYLAIKTGRWLEFDTVLLLDWGATYGPLTLGGDPWRSLSSVFLHVGLAHLFVNLCFLLLVGSLAERLLGSSAFLGVYLFTGLGAGLLSLGWFPMSVQVGASGAVFGTYGALIGCCLRGFRIVPHQVLGRHLAILLLLTGFILLDEFLMLRQSLVVHLGGALCGFAAGLLLGPSCRLRGRGSPVLRLGVFLVLAVGATWGLNRLAHFGARLALERTAPLAAALGHERMLLARFERAMDRWSDGDLTDKQLSGLFENDLLPAWRSMRTQFKLQIPDEEQLARINSSLMGELRQLKLPRTEGTAAKKPATPGEVAELFRVCSRARLEVWETWALHLKNDTISMNAMTDLLLVELLRIHLDELVNEDNPLHDWVEFSRTRIREKKLERNRAFGGK